MATQVPPMESNPEIMNTYLRKLGVSDSWKLIDIYGLDEDSLSVVPRPVLAVILLLPLSEAYEKSRLEEEATLAKNYPASPDNIFHLKQALSNVCGTVALVHSVANNISNIDVTGGPLEKYIKEAKNLDAAGKGALLETSKDLLEAYREVVSGGGADTAEVEESPNHHFVTFIHKDGKLFELDGRKSFPVERGPTSASKLLEDAARVCREFIAREPDNLGFNVVALVPSEPI